MPFAKVLGGIKNYVKDKAEGFKQGAVKYGPTILDVASKATKAAGAFGVPGANLVSEGLDVAKNLVKGVPNDDAKQKLDNFISNSKAESNKLAESDPSSNAPHVLNALRSGAKFVRKYYGGRSAKKKHTKYETSSKFIW
jgi:hypothetical protein